MPGRRATQSYRLADRRRRRAGPGSRTQTTVGRVSLLDLQAALNVEVAFIEEKVLALTKRDPAGYTLLHGELLTAYGGHAGSLSCLAAPAGF